jgi:hypothetical protein
MRSQNITAFLALLTRPSRPTFVPYVRDVALSHWMPNADWGLAPADILDALCTAGIRPTRFLPRSHQSAPSGSPQVFIFAYGIFKFPLES